MSLGPRSGGRHAGASARGRDDARLRHLYEVSKLLTRFEGVEPTLLAVVDELRVALALRSAIFILDAELSRRTIIWRADGVSDGWMRGSKARARESYAYLAGPARASHPELNDAPEKVEQHSREREHWATVLLPFAVDRRRIFGALQLESGEPLDEADIVFVNAIVNQVAVAIDRFAAIERRHAATDRRRLEAEDRQVSAEARQLRAERDEEEAREQRSVVEQHRAGVEAARTAAERRRAAAEALKERYEALVDNLDHAFVWEADPETRRMSYVSGRAEVLLGFPRQRWIEETDLWLSCVHPRDRRQLVQTLAAALADGTDKRCDHRCITADGRILWFHTGIHAAKRGTSVRLQGVSLDITPTKEAERKVRSQLDFTRAVTHSLGEGVIAVDRESRVTLFNSAAARLLGWSPDEAIGQPVARVVQILAADGTAVQEETSPFQGAMRRGGLSSSEEWLFARRDGAAFPVSHIAAPLERDGHVSGAVLAFQDISERRRTEKALQQAVEQAQRAVHDREDLLALVSHDLKNPLSVILMTVASMLKRLDSSSIAHANEQLQTVLRSAERMNRLIRDLLDSASVDAGKLVVDPQLIGVASLVEEAIDAVLPLAVAKTVAIDTDVAEDIPRVWADGSRVQQVFANLLGNALKFTPRGGRLTLAAAPVGDRVQFSVSDTGPGIAEDDVPHLFDRFWQSRRTARLGSGLGLSIVKGIVLAHGGQVWVRSTVGAGSTFFFTLRAG